MHPHVIFHIHQKVSAVGVSFVKSILCNGFFNPLNLLNELIFSPPSGDIFKKKDCHVPFYSGSILHWLSTVIDGHE